jgi:hypothetical protein
MLVWNLAEAMWELDHWIATAEQRERHGYDYENDMPVKPPVTLPKPAAEDVQKISISLQNFPKSSDDAKAKIARLMKKQ